MDVIVEYIDENALLPILNSSVFVRSGFDFVDNEIFGKGSILHQVIILYFILIFGGTLLYFASSGLSYYLFFIRWKEFYHPKTEPQPFPGQVALEIKVINNLLID